MPLFGHRVDSTNQAGQTTSSVKAVASSEDLESQMMNSDQLPRYTKQITWVVQL